MESIKHSYVHKPLKVVWICHAPSSVTETQLNMKKGFPKVQNTTAPWISNTLKTLSTEKKITLYVIAPHRGLAASSQMISLGSIEYHFFRPFERFFDSNYNNKVQRKARTLLNLLFPINRWFDYPINKMRVKRIVDRIQPDVIHLQGAENAYYSSTIFPFAKRYPVIITIQGFISHTKDKLNKKTKQRIRIECTIIKMFKHFGVRTTQMSKDLRSINPRVELHWLNYTIPKLRVLDVPKTHDLVFYARICKDKGIEDLILALKTVKKDFPEVRLLVLGPESSPSYTLFLKQLAIENGVDKCISWLGYQPSQDELFRKASAAKISVLPTYHDIIPGTIIESMQLGLPVVSYKVGSIPELNEDEECVLLVERGDIEGLAKQVIKLLSNNDLYKSMVERGIKCMDKRFQNRDIVQQHLEAYSKVIKDFQEKRNK